MNILVLLSILGATFGSQAPLHGVDAEEVISGEYIVVFKNEVGDDEVASHKETVHSMMANCTDADHKIMHEYHIGKNFRGYSAAMDDKLVAEIRGMTEVKYVETNQVVRTSQFQCELQVGATWGLVRTTLREWDSNPNDPINDYEYNKNAGKDVEVYIIDTGIDDTHNLFQGRAKRGVDFVDNPPPSNGDPNGHGTHVAGTVMADVYGLARGATAIGVRVLNANGSGSWAGVIAGINYVAEQKQTNPSKKIVGNMSLGGAYERSINDATNACVEAGVHMTVAGGNEYADACTRSPASAEMAVTAAASDTTDGRASFSNYGACIDLIAPGVNIISTTPNQGTASFSGTSMSAPHIAGVMAKILATTDDYNNPAAMKTYLKSIATKDKIYGFPLSPPTDNDLLFFECV